MITPALQNTIMLLAYLIAFGSILGVLTIFTKSFLDIDIVEFVVLLLKRDFKHFLEKRYLTYGDIVFVKFRDSYKKAMVRTNFKETSSLCLNFTDKTLNEELNIVTINYRRVVIPKFMSGMAKVLFAVKEKKHE